MNKNSIISNHTKIIKNLSKQYGFDYCGISLAQELSDDARRLENWLKNNYHGKMQYMENYFDKRINPAILVPEAKSVISLLFNFYPEQKQNANAPKVSKYAYGNDYHEIIKDKLYQLYSALKEQIGDFYARVFVDSAPVLEKAWAKKSGLGWVGKHSNLIVKQQSSFYFISEIICDLELEPDSPIKDHCGTCTRCIDACPTQAIVKPYVIDASKCISYLTIELKDELINNSFQKQMDNWLFGCDVCMDVCPWNSFAMPHNNEELHPCKEILNYTWKEWEALSEEQFKILFKHSPLKRTKFKGIKRNLKFIKPAL